MSTPNIPAGLAYKQTIENLLDAGFLDNEEPEESTELGSVQDLAGGESEVAEPCGPSDGVSL